VALEFNGSKNARELEALDVLLKGKSDEYKGRVLQYVRDAKVDANDPTFLLMAALGNLDVALIDLPLAIDASSKKSNTEIGKMISELRTLFQKAVKQAQEQIEAIDDTEGRIQQQLDTFEVRVNETLAALKHYRDESYKILKVSQGSYQKIVDDSHVQNQLLLAKVERLGRQLEEERNLRMEKPWKNAVNLPPLALVAVIVLPLMVGMSIGSNFTNQASASVDKLRTQIYNTFEKPQEEMIRKILMEEENKRTSRKKKRG
jgi:hypothetical protein